MLFNKTAGFQIHLFCFDVFAILFLHLMTSLNSAKMLRMFGSVFVTMYVMYLTCMKTFLERLQNTKCHWFNTSVKGLSVTCVKTIHENIHFDYYNDETGMNQI